MNTHSDAKAQFRVNLGCGQTPTPGWLNFDSSPSVFIAQIPALASLIRRLSGRILTSYQADFIQLASHHRIGYADVTKRVPLRDCSCSVVYSSHVIEHLNSDQVNLFLKEALRILAPEGVLRIAVPDLQIYVDSYLATQDADEFVQRLHLLPSNQGGLKSLVSAVAGNRSLHKWVYDEISLRKALVDCGFVKPIRLAPGETTIPNPGQLSLRERAWESLYMEALKPA
jgi:predicted SAM-dependent methyltransferase